MLKVAVGLAPPVTMIDKAGLSLSNLKVAVLLAAEVEPVVPTKLVKTFSFSSAFSLIVCSLQKSSAEKKPAVVSVATACNNPPARSP